MDKAREEARGVMRSAGNLRTGISPQQLQMALNTAEAAIEVKKQEEAAAALDILNQPGGSTPPARRSKPNTPRDRTGNSPAPTSTSKRKTPEPDSHAPAMDRTGSHH